MNIRVFHENEERTAYSEPRSVIKRRCISLVSYSLAFVNDQPLVTFQRAYGVYAESNSHPYLIRSVPGGYSIALEIGTRISHRVKLMQSITMMS